jgi:predicted ribosomally synthesized peptide with SipW-like signal peptide
MSARVEKIRTRRSDRSGRIRAVLALGAVVGIGTVLTLAAWTDNGAATGTFSTGSVDLELNGVDTAPVVTALALTNAKPGDVTYALLTVTNVGSLNFTYSIAPSITVPSTSSPLLESVLRLGVNAVPTASCTAGTFTASSDTVIVDRPLSTTTATAARALTATTGTEYLCFRVELPSNADNAVQGSTTTAAFTFTATQS